MVHVKSVFYVGILLACHVYARPQDNTAVSSASTSAPAAAKSANVTLVKSDIVPLDGNGSFRYDIELSDGTKLSQSGHTEAPGMGATESSIIIEGSYAYVAPDGKQISITYIADKNGFQPKGDAIPTQGNPTNTSQTTGKSSSTSPAAASASSSSASP